MFLFERMPYDLIYECIIGHLQLCYFINIKLCYKTLLLKLLILIIEAFKILAMK